ncbi:hypothetical protein GCM10007092_13280 [Thermus composti]|uniref:Glycerol-3-phosphate acyltransferase n=1 Tax=Thermus composti TaxID=532059 RepID=A0ABV6Q5H2_9DEIN|nr:glycerol-3-phosphate acyltransferase [Thermus composti]GGN00594.1 hypothetical protein GCM10007092_13280 [Thermus composti]
MLWALLLGYGVGGLPVAYWFGALRGRDLLREGGLGLGAVCRFLGPIPAFLVFLLDFFRGVMAVPLGEAVAQDPLGGLWAGMGAILGQAFSPWLFFRGGTAWPLAAGVLFAVDPRVLLGAGLLFLALYALSRRAFRALGATALALPLLFALLDPTPAYLFFGLGAGLALALSLREGL